jgi:hypothetical protein
MELSISRGAVSRADRPSSGYETDQPPSEGRVAPLMLAASSLSGKVIDAARCSAVAKGGIRFRNGRDVLGRTRRSLLASGCQSRRRRVRWRLPECPVART